MRKILVIVVALPLVAVALFFLSPDLLELSLLLDCGHPQDDPRCPPRMRGMGDVWALRGNLPRAKMWYERAAEAGDVPAMFDTGWAYQQLALAEARDVMALVQQQIAALGSGLQRGSENGAASWMREQLGRDGLASVDEELPHILPNPDDPERADRRDFAQAAAWYRKAADAGFGPAMNNLGELYRHGLGFKQDSAVALQWYVAAAQAGNPIGRWNVAIARMGDPATKQFWSTWTPTASHPIDLAEPILERTTLFGSARSPADRDKLRRAAATGTPVSIDITPMVPDSRLPVFHPAEPTPRPSRSGG